MTRAATAARGALAALTFGFVAHAGAQTADPAQAGRTVYDTHCAVCHAGNLRGGQSPPLAGEAFLARWGTRSARELLSLVQASMPPGVAGLLTDRESAQVVQYMLERNGAPAGGDALAAAAERPIDELLQRTPRATAAAAPAAPAAQPASEAPPLGVLVPGTVEDFAPLTADTLRDPAPADWPMIRRDYSASNYSPLDEITPANVAGLQLQWVFPMGDRGRRDRPSGTPIAAAGRRRSRA